jgi:hypothetical protein
MAASPRKLDIDLQHLGQIFTSQIKAPTHTLTQLGIVITFGDYQTFYESGKLFTQTSSNISWIGSLQALLVFTVGCIVGPIYDRGHLRFLLLAGTFASFSGT